VFGLLGRLFGVIGLVAVVGRCVMWMGGIRGEFDTDFVFVFGGVGLLVLGVWFQDLVDG